MSQTDGFRRTSPSCVSRILAVSALFGLAAGRALQAQAVQAVQADRDTAAVTAPGLADPVATQGIVSEIRAGLLAHDLPILGPQQEHGVDINTELLFVSPVSAQAVSGIAPAARWLFRPRPQVGVTGNLSHYTSQAYLGFDWTLPAVRGLIRRNDRLLFDIGFGGAINNDPTLPSVINRAHLGSNLLFHPNLQIGYGIGTHYTVALYYEHSSNANLAKVNDGLNNIGFRLAHQL
jgi:lipid A 3-O-deacylase